MRVPYVIHIGETVAEITTILAQYVFVDAENLELEGEVLTEENFKSSVDFVALEQAIDAVSPMSPVEIEYLLDDYGRDKAIDIHLNAYSGPPIFSAESDILRNVIAHELELHVNWTDYQMWKSNGSEVRC